MLNSGFAEDIKVYIGEESEREQLKDFSVVTFKHKVNGKDLGTIGIIGPKRMDYSKVISVMKYINQKLMVIIKRKKVQNGRERKKRRIRKNETQEQNTEMIPKQDYDELDDRYKRILAEFENFKKRSSKERDGLYNSILSDVVEVILPVVDNLENAAKAETADESYKQGVELVLKYKF